MHVVVRAVIDIVDVLVVPKVVVVVVVLVLGVGVVDVTAVVGEGRRVDVGVVVDPPSDFGSSIWKPTSDVGVGEIAELVVAVVDVLVVNGVGVSVAVVLVVDGVVVAVVIVVVRSFFRDTSRCRRSRACAVFSKISHN